jgi:hypothetical protein
MRKGCAANSSTPTGRKPTSHAVHVTSTCAISFIRATASRFGASAVTNIELVTQVVAKAVHMTYAPMPRRVSPGAEP